LSLSFFSSFLATIQRPKSGTAPVKPSAPSNEDEFYEDDKNLDPLPVDPEKAMEEVSPFRKSKLLWWI